MDEPYRPSIYRRFSIEKSLCGYSVNRGVKKSMFWLPITSAKNYLKKSTFVSIVGPGKILKIYTWFMSLIGLLYIHKKPNDYLLLVMYK